MAKKRVLKKKPVIMLVLFLLLIVFGVVGLSKLLHKEEVIVKNDMFLASSEYKIKAHSLDKTVSIEIPRGTKVEVYEKTVTEEEKEYNKILYNEVDYLIDLNQTVLEKKDVVRETILYVRTPVTVYKNDKDNSILGYLEKGTKLEVIGFDEVDDEGVVNMYQINYYLDEEVVEKGYVYSKYLVETEEDALANYNEGSVYDTHKDRKFSYNLYGGSAANLDYYPYEKVSFEGNELLKSAKTLYMNGDSKTIKNVDEYIKIVKDNNMNAIVVDIKDGALAYDSELAKATLGKQYYFNNSMEIYKEAIDKIKEAGIYVIGRIVAFNDEAFAKANPDEAILYPSGNKTSWVSAYSRKSWEYNVSLAIEAIEAFGFNEIQYDYVRFPESSYSMSRDKYNFRNKYNEDKAVAVQNFAFYATDQLHKYNTYISFDVFGECSGTYVTAYGQYWPAISNIVDVISAMPYPDHFDKGQYGLSIPWTKPYDILLGWGKTAAARQKEIKTPAVARTWIQAYNAIKEPKITYGSTQVLAQIKGLKDAGLDGGYITWNAGSSLTKYNSLASAFKEDY